MIQTRVIPVLLLKKLGLYKGIGFKKHKYVGDPINAVKIFNDKEIDELVILDIESSKTHNKSNYSFLKDIVSEAFMPVAYGGGIGSLDAAVNIFSIGIEKIIMNSAVFKDYNLISEIAKIYGSQSVVVSVDVRQNLFGKYVLYSYSGSKKEKISLQEHIMKVEQAGAGELLINNIDHDGKMNGYDLNLIKLLSQMVSIPVIAGCGAGQFSDFKNAINAGATAVAAGSLFVFHGPHRAVLISYPKPGEIKILFGGVKDV